MFNKQKTIFRTQLFWKKLLTINKQKTIFRTQVFRKKLMMFNLMSKLMDSV